MRAVTAPRAADLKRPEVPLPRIRRVRHSGRVPDEPEGPEDYFRARGYEIQVEERDLHAEYMAAGEPGRASFFAENRRYYCVNLMRSGGIVASNYAHGETLDDALKEARRRYGSEQGIAILGARNVPLARVTSSNTGWVRGRCRRGILTAWDSFGSSADSPSRPRPTIPAGMPSRRRSSACTGRRIRGTGCWTRRLDCSPQSWKGSMPGTREIIGTS